MADFLDEKRQRDRRAAEGAAPARGRVQPAGEGRGGARRASATAERGPHARPRRRGRGRPRGSGTRAKQALELVRARPGITIRELAEAMGIHANYLYRVMPTLESEGSVVKRDRGWHPA